MVLNRETSPTVGGDFPPGPRKVYYMREIGPSVRLSTTLIWLIGWVTQTFAHIAGLMLSPGKKTEITPATLAIEAGELGWQNIEFEEIEKSAGEFLSADRIFRFVVDPRDPYLKQLRANLKTSPVSHVFWDPRTGSQNYVGGVLQSLAVGIIFAYRNIIPIAFGTDVSHRLWRMKMIAVTASTGVCLSLISPRRIRSLFPHGRIIGPMIMPISRTTFELLGRRLEEGSGQVREGVGFMGSLYEPRLTILNEIRQQLAHDGQDFDIKGRPLGKKKHPSRQYWDYLLRTRIVVTTTSQVASAGFDCRDANQLVYRCTEALAAGAVLVVENVMDLDKFFNDGEHVAVFDTPLQAVQIIRKILRNPRVESSLRENGRTRVGELVRTHAFWRAVDSSLGVKGLR